MSFIAGVCSHRGGASYHSLPCFFLKGQIQDFLVSGSVDLDTALVLVNAIYFKGIWKTAFKEEHTREVPFNVTEVGGLGSRRAQTQLLARTAVGSHSPHSGCYTYNLLLSQVG